ncbi:Retrovirus-related Pol polyprotein from transposon 17.6, partial [Mucuna pruriens]
MVKEKLEACPSTLIGFAGEQVERSEEPLIFEQPLEPLRVIVSTPHLCMKYLVADRVGTIQADQQTTCRCYKVYVEDMVAKLANGKQHCELLTRVFNVLRKHKLKLNLKKCSFGVQARKFLGFMLIRRGIEANSDKCEAVINMRSPRSVKEVQQLASQITALSWFLSRSAKRALPIFQCRRRRERFQWKEAC